MLLDTIRVQYDSTGCARDIAHGGEPHFRPKIIHALAVAQVSQDLPGRGQAQKLQGGR
jgi:hypothetical protein